MKRLSVLLVLCAMMGMAACYVGKLPPIPGHHWRHAPFGAELYSDDGIEAASFDESSTGDAAQVCQFEPNSGCHYFESDAQALNWLAAQYAQTSEAK